MGLQHDERLLYRLNACCAGNQIVAQAVINHLLAVRDRLQELDSHIPRRTYSRCRRVFHGEGADHALPRALWGRAWIRIDLQRAGDGEIWNAWKHGRGGDVDKSTGVGVRLRIGPRERRRRRVVIQQDVAVAVVFEEESCDSQTLLDHEQE